MNPSLQLDFVQMMLRLNQHIYSVVEDFPPTEETEQDFKAAVAELRAKVYEAASYLSYLEEKGLIYGNGDHVAVEIADYAVERLSQRWKQKAIAPSPQS